jgi:tetratricopeptide (TPR) repeat protein
VLEGAGLTISPAVAPAARVGADFGQVGQDLGVEEKLRAQGCEAEAQRQASQAREQRLKAARDEAQRRATASWSAISGQAEACLALPSAQRQACLDSVQRWIKVAREIPVSLDAGLERVQTACGSREVAFSEERDFVSAQELAAAQALEKRLLASEPEPSAAALVAPAPAGSSLSYARWRELHVITNEAVQARARQARAQAIEQVKDLFAHAELTDESKPELLLRLAELYHEEGRDLASRGEATTALTWEQQAVKLAETALRSYPQYARADQLTALLAEALQATGEADRALAEWTRLVRTYPDSALLPEAYISIGETYLGKSEAFKALMAYQKASVFRDHADQAFALYRLALCYYKVGEYSKAIETAQSSVLRLQAGGGSRPAQALLPVVLADLLRDYRNAGQQAAGRKWLEAQGRADLAGML